jgi:hypothetical protein
MNLHSAARLLSFPVVGEWYTLRQTPRERMSNTTFNIEPIAHAINARAKPYSIGALQTIRKELHGFAKRPGTNIFSGQTIHPHWAFHHGGRSELQFNIGLEDHTDENELRHGVAFSFELSQALPSIDVLVPKARLFGEYLQLYPDLYADMRMWDYRDGKRGNDYPPGPVLPELVRPGCFVFFGTAPAARRHRLPHNSCGFRPAIAALSVCRERRPRAAWIRGGQRFPVSCWMHGESIGDDRLARRTRTERQSAPHIATG